MSRFSRDLTLFDRRLDYDLMTRKLNKPGLPVRQHGPRATITRKGGRASVRDRRISTPAGHTKMFSGTSLAVVDYGLVEIIRRQRKGIPCKAVSMMAHKLDMSVAAFISELSLPKGMRKSVHGHGGNLSAVAAERVIRVARIQRRATEVLENESDARAWLKLANRALGGRTPLSFLDTGSGSDLVTEELMRIEQGIVA